MECTRTKLRMLVALLMHSPEFAASFDKKYNRAKIDVELAKHDFCEICR